MSFEGLHAQLAQRLGQVEGRILEALHTDVSLLDATNRSLLERPGKMMRPMLSLLMADVLGGGGEDCIRGAACLELLHNASLLHDDVVDGARDRRGRPTVASLLSGGAAVLIGDFWMVRALPLLLEMEQNRDRKLRICSDVLSQLAEGELLQMQKASSGDTLEADYLRIIHCKTGSLFEASALLGALSTPASEEQIRCAGHFGRQLGRVFQMRDDIFDYLDSPAGIGKPVGIDLKEQKITLPLLCVLEKATPQEEKDIRSRMIHVADEPELAAGIRDFVLSRGGIDLAEARIERELQTALGYTESFPASAAREALQELARLAAQRKQ